MVIIYHLKSTATTSGTDQFDFGNSFWRRYRSEEISPSSSYQLRRSSHSHSVLSDAKHSTWTTHGFYYSSSMRGGRVQGRQESKVGLTQLCSWDLFCTQLVQFLLLLLLLLCNILMYILHTAVFSCCTAGPAVLVWSARWTHFCIAMAQMYEVVLDVGHWGLGRDAVWRKSFVFNWRQLSRAPWQTESEDIFFKSKSGRLLP